MALAIFARGHADAAAEDGGEILAAGEAEIEGDMSDVVAGFGETPASFGDALVKNVFVGRKAHLCLEAFPEAGFAEADFLGQFGYPGALHVLIAVQDLQGTANAPGDERLRRDYGW